MSNNIRTLADRIRNEVADRPTLREWAAAAEALQARAEQAEPPALPTTGIDVRRTRAGWKIESAAELTNEQACAIVFRADPSDVAMGDYVEVHDPEGIRAGEVYRATLHRQAFAPAYVTVEIDLS